MLFATGQLFAQGTVTIRGRFTNPASDSIFISHNNSRLVYDPTEYKAELDEGAFEYTLQVREEYTPVIIRHGRHAAELMVQPGDSLEMLANAADSTWIPEYTGRGSDRANYLAKHAATMGLLDRYAIKMQRYLSKDARSFIAGMELEQKKELDYLEQNKAGLAPAFVSYLRNSYKYFTYFCRYQYPTLHEVIANKSYSIAAIPKQNYDATRDIPPAFSDSLMGLVPYRLYADMFYRMKLEEAGFLNDSIDGYKVLDSITVLAVKNMPTATTEFVVAMGLYSSVRTIPVKIAEERVAAFKKRWPASIYKSDLEAQLGIAKRLAQGEKAFDFTFTTPQGKTGKLSDFKGKIVLLSFWSTDYRQCIQEMRAVAQMATKYTDIVFLHVSLDANEAAWVAAIEENKISGVHTREEAGWKSFLAKIYGVQALPTFFFIDRDGRFALKRTPYPSQSGIMAPTADSLLAKPYTPEEPKDKKEPAPKE